jgi:L-threonylcarbamoyladenylate synthase
MERKFKTKIMTIEEGLGLAVEFLREGEVVAFPTETVYGLGANALDAQACRKIFEIKGRPADNPLIVHVTSIESAKSVVGKWTDQAQMCADRFWPGPLTLVLPKAGIIPDIVSAGLETVAVRIPAHPAALKLIQASGFPLAAPSANISGKPSPTEGRHVWRDLRGKLPLIIEGGKCKVGLESTVLDLSGEVPTVLRPGGVTYEQLQAVLGKVEIEKALREEKEVLSRPRSPGMKYRHYAPEGKVILLKGETRKRKEEIAGLVANKKTGDKIALLCLEETVPLLSLAEKGGIDFIFVLGSKQKPQEAASRLFEGLRRCDEERINLILAEEMPEEGIGFAFMNRLKKAAGKENFSDPKKI